MRLASVLPLFPLAGAVIGFLFGRHAEFDVLLTTIVGFLIGLTPFFLLIAAGMALDAWSPARPDCICGESKSEGYSFDDMDRDEEGTPCAFRYHCPKCGRSYVLRDGEFREIRNDHEMPYQKRNRWGRWSPC